METRVFDFDVDFGGAANVVGVLVLRIPGVDGVVRYLDDLLAAGWRPIHWSTLSSEMSSVAKYRVVMQRKKVQGMTGTTEDRSATGAKFA